ncbi:MAG TPA: YdiU family protein [Pseudoxanthomonas sp.]|nr:YdiU family protein [Pseudoxanthomonas sp.]
MSTLRYDNAFVRELPGDTEQGPRRREVLGALWSSVTPTPVSAPQLLAWSREMGDTLGLSEADVEDPAFAQVFAGNALWPGMQPFASNYGGHQFGAWAGQLGDGRAISLGEVLDAQDQRWELQLKGAGPTPYSRTADGRAVLRSSIREFLCSEAMHHLGVPTTRALCLLATGDAVVRDMFYDGHPRAEPGAIVCRVAPSFLRFGHFELPASRGDVDLLRQLADFCIRRDFPQLMPLPAGEARYAAWFAEVARRTAVMIAHWMRVGFVHGVMNTDNLSILGLTIDYGPYGWIDDYNPDWTPNTTDAGGGRYRFGWQPKIAYWNLTRLAHALSPLFTDVEPLQQGLQLYVDSYYAAERNNVARKLGLAEADEDDMAHVNRLHGLLQTGEVDMTLFYRALMDIDTQAPSLDGFAPAFYDATRRDAIAGDLLDWLRHYADRLRRDPLSAPERRERMRLANPRYVLRNYLAQEVIDRAEAGDPSGIAELLEVMRHPYDDQPGRERYAARRPDWARDRAGCSMLSCSS